MSGSDSGLAEQLRELQAEVVQLRAANEGWRRKFCPAGKHYKGSSTQSRRNPETGEFEVSTFETYRCWACDRDKRMAECPHDGDIQPERMAFGYGWSCAACGKYFGHVDVPKDEALALVREAQP